jgi:gliding motility-associated-like protein
MKAIRGTFVLLFVAWLNLPATAQYSWFNYYIGAGYYSGVEDISADADDNIVGIGNFQDGVDIHGDIPTGTGSFIIKVSKNGEHIWHKVIKNESGSTFWSFTNLETDAAGSIYITGTFSKKITIDQTTITNSADYSTLIGKFSKDGELQWTKVLPWLQEAIDLKVNENGDVLFLSHHYGTLAIDQVSINIGSNAFALMLDTQGILKWGKAIGSPDAYYTWPKACAIDEDGNAYCHGIFRNTLSLDGKTVTSGGGNYDFFVAKLNTSGACEWLTAAERKIPSGRETSNPPNGLVIERGSIDADNEGNVYFGGTFWESMKIGNLEETGNKSFIIKLNAAGEPQWFKTPSLASDNVSIDDVVCKNENVYFGGQMQSLFFGAYDQSGDVAIAPMTFPLNADIATGLTVDSKDSVYMSGREYTVSKLKGFICKPGEGSVITPPPPTLPASAAAISGDQKFCVNQATLTFDAPNISGATSYEWEITNDEGSEIIVTSSSILELSLADYSIEGDFSIRVRGSNQNGKGLYSEAFDVKAAYMITEVPVLKANCDQIEASGDFVSTSINWYRNNQMETRYTGMAINPVDPGSYYVTITGDCNTVASEPVDFGPVSTDELFIPNVITPNGDDFNQFFVIDSKVEGPALRIFNRWGRTVLEAPHYNNGWDGGDVPPGVYYYHLTSPCLSEPIRGSLNVLK